MRRKLAVFGLFAMIVLGSAFFIFRSEVSEQLQKPKATIALSSPFAGGLSEQTKGGDVQAVRHENKDWLTSYTALSEDETKEVEVVWRQIKSYHSGGKMNSTEMDDFRATVFKFDERLLAHVGRAIIFESRALTKTQEGSEKVIDMIDVLTYFAAQGTDWPLAHEIIRDIATRSINFSAPTTPYERSQANITIQFFEQFARFHPDEASEFILTAIEKSQRQPYLAYFRTGLSLAGKTQAEIDQKLTSFL